MVDEIKDDGEWEYKVVDAFIGGVDLSKRPTSLEDNQLVDVSNLYSQKNRLLIDTGYLTFGAVVRGTPQASEQFFKTNGTDELVLITTATVYKYISSEWQYISDSTSTTCTDGEPAGETSIVVGAIAGFSSADYVGITLDDGTQHQTTINGAPTGSTIVITDAIPVGRTVSIGAAFIKAVDLTGSLDILISLVTIPDQDWLVFTNGVEKPKRYDGTDIIDVPNLPSSGNTLCKVVSYFNGHLMLLGTTEGGTAYPQRARNSDTNDPSEWTTGNAGYVDLTDSEDFIVASAGLGPYNIIYKERSIVRQEWIGSAARLFKYTTVITGEGALSQDSVVDMGDYHLFVGNANIYEYRGGFSYEAIGDEIYFKVFGTTGELNPSYKQRVFAIYVEEVDEVWIFYPSGANTTCDSLLRFNQSEKTWWPRALVDNMIGYGFYQRSASKTWSELTGDWTDQTWQWNSVTLLANAPTTLLLGNSPLQVYEYDYTTTTDDGTDIPWSLTTKDFMHEHYHMRINLIEMMVKGTSILTEYSVDRGATWVAIETFTPGAAFTRQRLWLQLIGRPVRFRLSGTGGGFELEWFAFEFTLESEQ